MALYSKPVRLLMRDMADDLLKQDGDVLTTQQALTWFKQHYPMVKTGTITAHLRRLSTNAPSRVHHSATPQDDLFYQVDGSRFRRYLPANDPPPIYEESNPGVGSEQPLPSGEDESDAPPPAGSEQFAYEKDLRNYLAKNLHVIEPGLQLFEEEGVKGIEYPAGGRYIDILAVDGDNNLVVIELKVSRGYDRVVGQLMRYMAWIKTNQADEGQKVRGIIVAREISEDLMMACSLMSDVQLFEYQLSLSVRQVAAG